MGSRLYIVGALVIVLLIWGPIDYSWPAWLAIRIGYLIAIPLFALFVLHLIWKTWKPDDAAEDRLVRTLAGLTAGLFLAFAFFEGTAKTHVGNTQWVQTHDGMEAVGDDIILPGPDRENVIMLIAAAGFAFWFGASKTESKK